MEWNTSWDRGSDAKGRGSTGPDTPISPWVRRNAGVSYAWPVRLSQISAISWQMSWGLMHAVPMPSPLKWKLQRHCISMHLGRSSIPFYWTHFTIGNKFGYTCSYVRSSPTCWGIHQIPRYTWQPGKNKAGVLDQVWVPWRPWCYRLHPCAATCPISKRTHIHKPEGNSFD